MRFLIKKIDNTLHCIWRIAYKNIFQLPLDLLPDGPSPSEHFRHTEIKSSTQSQKSLPSLLEFVLNIHELLTQSKQLLYYPWILLLLVSPTLASPIFVLLYKLKKYTYKSHLTTASKYTASSLILHKNIYSFCLLPYSLVRTMSKKMPETHSTSGAREAHKKSNGWHCHSLMAFKFTICEEKMEGNK